ncbi:MAG: 50S ribosomal protein L4 [Lachnospiraceae bacterium]|nr:50S ribosomal protein L4 [Lachnospiraceae bacterium]
MAEVSVYSTEGKETGKIDLSDAVFGIEPNEHLVHMAVKQFLANQRQGTQKAKTRSEVSGGGKKPWRQKGTGHARQGSTRAPQWKGGGMVFAPVPRDYSFKMNRKEKRIALKSVLSSKVLDKKLCVIDGLSFTEPKTKEFAKVLSNLNLDKAIFVIDEKDADRANIILSAKNIPTVITAAPNTINVFDLLKYDTVVLTKDAAKTIEEVYA